MTYYVHLSRGYVSSCTTGPSVDPAFSYGLYLYLHSRPSDIIRQGKLNNSAPATNLLAKRTQDGCR